MADKISFARRYRPTSLDDYIGNERLKETVQNYLKSNKPQSILLTGNTGCGKTTMARLIVKEYLCENWAVNKCACGVCDTCKSLNEYIGTGDTENVFDVTEIDITDKSGKRDLDSVFETVEYPSINGGWKVYIADEVHAASTAAQTRMLKLIEEPPEKVLFIFCTTDPQKMLDTLKNRCQLKLQVTKPSLSDLTKLLKKVCLEEGKDYDMEGLRTIAGRSEFVIRDSLNNLERVLETKGNAKASSVNQEFHEISEGIIFDFFNAYRERNFLEYINILYKIKTTFDFNQFLVTLTNFTIRGVYILNGIDVEGLSPEEIKSYSKLFKTFSSSEISTILSGIKRMGVGDIEANFMSFIYTDIKEEKEDSQSLIVPSGKLEVDSEGSPNEVSFRNSVLKHREKDKLQKGLDSLSDVSREVGLTDALGLFQLEKVSG